MEPYLVNRSWLEEPALKQLMAALNKHGDETRIIGGAVRNALLGEEIADVDCASTATPDRLTILAERVGFKVIPTGIDHGTLTVVVDGKSFEVTTLRSDVATDGRHAEVAFTRDFSVDAERRDFTMNALSIDANGEIHDPLGGYADLVRREVKFIGDAETRIQEDYLRSLRFFRFFAWYGSGRPDRDALRAIVRTKSGLAQLSVERVWSEVKKILAAPTPERAILWMRTTEVLNAVLPENWGLDQFHWLLNAEREANWSPDPMRRLQAMLQPSQDIVEALATRLKISNDERDRLKNWADEASKKRDYVNMSVVDLAKIAYQADREALGDALFHEFAKRFAKEEEGQDRVLALIDFLKTWERPTFPVSGDDLIARGIAPGRMLGDTLKKLEAMWVESNFTHSKAEILSSLD